MTPVTNPSRTVAKSSLRWLWITLGVVLGCGVLLFAGVVYGVTSCFRLGSEARALRQAVMESSPQPWRQKFALNAGPITTGLIRQGVAHTRLDPQAQTALQAVRAAQVGVYELPSETAALSFEAIRDAADVKLRRNGWERLLCVAEGQRLVMVYVPSKEVSLDRLKCCVLVLDERQMVLASVHLNLKPLLELIPKERWDEVVAVARS